MNKIDGIIIKILPGTVTPSVGDSFRANGVDLSVDCSKSLDDEMKNLQVRKSYNGTEFFCWVIKVGNNKMRFILYFKI